MNENLTPNPDPLGDLLGPPTLPAGDDDLQDRLRRRTCRLLRWRRWRRHLVGAVALAACYAAGVATSRWLPPPPPAPPEIVHQPESPPALPKAASTAVALEWQALDRPEYRTALYRQAGDQYLSEESDPESALRCYTAALNTGAAANQAVSPEDNWLLMAIKDAREKEKPHAKNEH